MPFTDFPNGLTSFGVPLIGNAGAIPVTNGTYYFVCNRAGANGSDGNPGTDAAAPLATLSQAFTNVTTLENDVIVILPGHSETITGVGGLTCSKAGVTVVGLGSFNTRPTFLMDGGTTVSFVVSGANFTIQNCVFKSGHSQVVTCFGITAVGCRIDSCEFGNNTTNEDFLTCIKATSTSDNNADGLAVVNCRWYTADTDDLEFIEINATLDRFVCARNYVRTVGTASPMILVATGKLLTNALVEWNMLFNLMTANELFISNDGTTNTGIFSNNYVGHADVTGAHDAGWDAGGFRLFNNLSTSVDNLQGVVVPAADVNL